jgi:hypothetical protein
VINNVRRVGPLSLPPYKFDSKFYPTKYSFPLYKYLSIHLKSFMHYSNHSLSFRSKTSHSPTNIMTPLSKKPLFNQFISSLVFFLLVVIILQLVCTSTASVSSITSPFVYTKSKVKIAEELKEAKALLNWKTSLHIKSQSLLSSWDGSTPCNWVGISCDKSTSVTHVNLSSYGLRGTLHNLSFQSFPNLLSLDLSYNSLYGTIPSNISHLSKLSALNISANQLTGAIPASLGNLSNLTILYLLTEPTFWFHPSRIRNAEFFG